MNTLPFKEVHVDEKKSVRTFSPKDSDDMVWHQDAENRKVKLVSGTGWYLQLDNELPRLLRAKRWHIIPKLKWHRLICTSISSMAVIEVVRLEDI